MSLKSQFVAAAAAAVLAGSAFAGGADKILVRDQYARVSSPAAKAGAAFMQIVNQTDADDRLIGVRSDAAARVQLHTHKESDDGVMKMMHVEDGFAIAGGGTLMLKRGGDHVMFMGLTRALNHGDAVTLTLVFEKAGEVEVEVPVDLERKAGGHGSHSN
ncbi:copper chaperone PCu(A)C [Leisingera methylohalidivorans]|uniref:Copper(I)-binding protein n=1 Tax=Leisingera methylohalidivorans DSM 14336 TaxID=999552 RepID=V9VSB7_9RHOB|nr:copper chaperone PCu(A)C [Leisingera methylohalidivorans]AHD00220.1 copper(I)-binding protein [Leisingera methylohalidivorans DSM 14336]